MKVTTENETSTITADSVVHAYDQVLHYTDGSTDVMHKHNTYKLVRSYTEDYTREEGTRTITYRHREVKVYADGTKGDYVTRVSRENYANALKGFSAM